VDFSYWDKVEDFQLDDIIFLWIGGVRDVATARQAIDLGLRLAMAVVDNKLPCSNFISIPPKGLATLVYSKANIAQSCLSWRIKRNDLKVWCESKGYKPAFLFPEVRNTRSEATELLDPDSPTYPLELHIALRAWEMVSANHSPKKSPKQKILAWLNAHYPDLSEEAKNRIATIANWKKQGGAPSSE